MIMINCIYPCLFENEGYCTLTHATAVSSTTNKSCAYFKEKKSMRKPHRQ
ncbi:hypothetical protein RH915_03875 [Serpentinicella sp. ANB-PHB4]|nr:hypothetical protein [Serpentinicella sp. ANB-PHB4]MDR5658623.1 hypothetical protein [Serpentinicella sp. ANB-PHB4]